MKFIQLQVRPGEEGFFFLTSCESTGMGMRERDTQLLLH